MNIRGRKDIKVFNECPSQVNLIGQRREYIFPPCTDEGPTMNFVDFDEIEYAHSRGQLFNLGLLVFDEKEQGDIYDALGIKDWRNKVWFQKDIEDYILNPTVDKMQRIIDVKNLSAFERIRAVMVRYVNEKRDISQNVINLINARYRELSSGVVTSKIVIKQSDVEQNISTDEAAELRKQIEELKNLVREMAANGNTAAPDKVQDETAPKPVSEKKPTRRATTKK